MWKCHKCGKPVYFAERKQSLGYDWHPECLRCEECGKRLDPGQHAEHKGVPYCHVPCYGALFGPQLFGHGTRVESHKSFGQKGPGSRASSGPPLPRSHLDSKLKAFNQFYDGRSGEIKSREVNGRLVLEGALRIYWGVHGVIHLKEDDDQRTVVTVRKRNSCRLNNGLDDMDDRSPPPPPPPQPQSGTPQQSLPTSPTSSVADNGRSLTLPNKLDVRNMEWDELDELLRVERQMDEADKLYQTMPTHKCHRDDSWIEQPPALSRSMSGPDWVRPESSESDCDEEGTGSVSGGGGGGGGGVGRRAARTGAAAIRRRSGKRRSRTKLKRRCSINGHFYNRETSFFTPPHGSQMSVWVTSLVSTYEVINLMLEKYKVDSHPDNFALFVVHDNGEQRRLRDDEYPLLVRVLLGPHEDVVKLFLMDRHNTPEVSNEVAQFLNLSLAECRAILDQYKVEEEREVFRIMEKYREMRRRIKQRMDHLKVRL